MKITGWRFYVMCFLVGYGAGSLLVDIIGWVF